MLVNGQEDDEIARALDITPADVGAALTGWREETASFLGQPDDVQDGFVKDEIGGFMRLTMLRVSPEARREFSDQLLVEMADVPFDLLRQGMAEARRKISHPERLVPFLFDFVEGRLAKLRAEGEKLHALARIVGA